MPADYICSFWAEKTILVRDVCLLSIAGDLLENSMEKQQVISKFYVQSKRKKTGCLSLNINRDIYKCCGLRVLKSWVRVNRFTILLERSIATYGNNKARKGVNIPIKYNPIYISYEAFLGLLEYLWGPWYL